MRPGEGIEDLFANNRAWANGQIQENPRFFHDLAQQQTPAYLWLGCSDSRVPANQIMGLRPGEVFVQRNIANVVSLTDFNCLSVIQFAVEVLKVRHIIVTGHYGCGGIDAAITGRAPSLVDHWLENVRIVARANVAELSAIKDPTAKQNRLCELNVIAQVHNVSQTPIVKNAWDRATPLTVHGLVYSLENGIVQPVCPSVASATDVQRL